VASQGVWVSADVILKMGVKEVLYRTKDLGWGRTPMFIARLQHYAGSFRSACEWPARGYSNRTAADQPALLTHNGHRSDNRCSATSDFPREI
jgi:hypothetical protein